MIGLQTTNLEPKQKLYSPTERKTLLDFIYDWQGNVARPEQRVPSGEWQVWLILAGRGAGKTRTGAETIRHWHETGQCGRMAIVGEDAADARDVMIEGESGIMAISPSWDRPTYNSSIKRLTWLDGSMATLYSSVDPESLRGPQHDGAWCDELAKWRYSQLTWDNLQMGMRLGKNPRTVVTTTPKPIRLLKDLLERPTTHVTRGTTYDNLANLSPAFSDIIRRYEGTRLGRQELNAELLEDVEGALWRRQTIEDNRVTKAPELTRIVVAIDPSATGNATSDEAGVITAGKSLDGHYYVLEDRSVRAMPHVWAAQAVTAYHDFKADRIIAESNNGGEMIRNVIRGVDSSVPVQLVHASRGKLTRAEPISLLYEQNKVHHVGTFPQLEDEMCGWVPGEDSPNRMDALVWALTALHSKVIGHA